MSAPVEKALHVVLPIGVALTMFRRADAWSVDRDGRFDRRGAALLIWAKAAPANRERLESQGMARFLWWTPGDGQATIETIAWRPGVGGSEALVWEALETLAGQPLRPDAV